MRRPRKRRIAACLLAFAWPTSAFQTAFITTTKIRERPYSSALFTLQTDESGPLTVIKQNIQSRLQPTVSSNIETDAASNGLLKVEASPSEKARMLALLWIVALLSSLDRVAMSVAIIPMSNEYLFTDTFKGSISSFFSIGYGVLIIPAGLVVASASPRLVMAGGLCIWSLATVLTPLSTNLYETFMPLLIVRAWVGAAESVVQPTIQRFLSAWTGPQEKSSVMAIMQSGFQTGTVLAYLISPTVMDSTGGWRGLFLTYGGLGLLTLIPWLAFAQDAPSKAMENGKPTETQLEQSFTEKLEDAMDVIRQAPVKDFFQSKGVWAMLLAHSAKNWGLYQTLAWTPTFYSQQYGIGVRDSAFLSVLPSLAAIGAGLLAGNAADFVIKIRESTGEELTLIRKVFQCIGLYGPAIALGSLALDLPDDPLIAQGILTASVAASAFNSAGFEAANQEKAGEKWAGLLYSVTTLPAVMFGTLGVYMTGQILDNTGQDWSLVFGLTSIISAIGATAFVALYDSKKEFD